MRATWQEGPSTRSGKTIYITSVPYTVNKSTLVERIADVALSRKLPHLRRRPRPVDGRRADRAGTEGRRRRAHGDGVPLQAHAAPVELPGEPDVPDSDGEPGRLQARAARAAPDPLALPALPARRRARAAEVRARGAEEAHPHPRRLRDRLRRARRDPEDRPEVGGQGGRGREDHGAVRARRRADRRHPRTEDLPAGPSRNPGHPAGAGGQAEAREGDRRAAQARSGSAGRSSATRSRRSRRRTATRDGRRSSARRPTRITPPTTSSSKKTTSSSSRATGG